MFRHPHSLRRACGSISLPYALMWAVSVACAPTGNGGQGDAGEFDSGSVPLRDASTRPPESELCGDGVDNDGDRRIDEGCPCAPGDVQLCYRGPSSTRHQGSCSDGVQRCRGADPEFAGWGACEGDLLPALERCDGGDHDCDGQIDEGCECQTGDTRACAEQYDLPGPCQPGTETCTLEGTWGPCVGAVAPVSEVCDDDTDNDCNGETDEGCEQSCGLDCEPGYVCVYGPYFLCSYPPAAGCSCSVQCVPEEVGGPQTCDCGPSCPYD